MEATDEFKVELTKKELSRWASFIYKEAIEQPLNFQQTRYLSTTIIKVIKKERMNQ